MSEYYDNFIADFKQYENSAMIRKAFAFAEKAHEGQLRKSGEPYFNHPYAVVRILAELNIDEASITAGLLHDVIEDTEYTYEDVAHEFSPEVANIVDGVTKLTNFEFKSKEEQQAESIRKMLLAMANDIRVIIIKLADRLHNMRTLKYQTEQKQLEKSRETLEIYAPLAHRLGINAIKWELEDLSLKYLDPKAYHEIAARLNATRVERQKYIDNIIAQIKQRIAAVGIHANIEGRPKHIYSIYRKMKLQEKTFDELYDLLAIRIIVDSMKDCYGALGVVHTIWRPIPMRFKDYIAVPKSNMYQSLHTTLLGEDGKPFEVQIRTFEMHKTAEYGIAAHWKYKEGKQGKDEYDNKLTWLRELMEWQKELKDSHEFMEALKVDIFSDHVFVFTPKGDVKDFVKGSTPIDFAYKVHSDIGNKCVGAKVNGKIVPLSYELKTGDIVSVVTSAQSKGPSRDWLKFVKTPQARNKIKLWFKKQLKEENILKGKENLEKEAKRRGYEVSMLLKPEYLMQIMKKMNYNSSDDLFASIGYGGVTVNQILLKLIERYEKTHREGENDDEIKLPLLKKTGKQKNDEGIIVKGESGMVVRLAKCCNPVYGDKIVGYITRGRGVSVHRADCSNLNDVDFQKNRLIDVAWAPKQETNYSVEIELVVVDRRGLIAEITQMLSAMGKSIIGMNTRRTKNQLIISICIDIKDLNDLELVLLKLRQIENVLKAYRVNS